MPTASTARVTLQVSLSAARNRSSFSLVQLRPDVRCSCGFRPRPSIGTNAVRPAFRPTLVLPLILSSCRACRNGVSKAQTNRAVAPCGAPPVRSRRGRLAILHCAYRVPKQRDAVKSYLTYSVLLLDSDDVLGVAIDQDGHI